MLGERENFLRIQHAFFVLCVHGSRAKAAKKIMKRKEKFSISSFPRSIYGKMTQIGHTTDFPLRLMPQKIYTLAKPGKEQKTLSRDGRGEESKVQSVGRV